jgi:hypothetical protein
MADLAFPASEEYSFHGPTAKGKSMPGFFKLIRLGVVLSVALKCSGADTTKGKTGRLSGNVRILSDDKTEVTLRKGTVDRIVTIRSATKFNLQANGGTKTPGSIDDVKENKYMACTGTWDGAKLAATACTISSATQH